VVGSLKRAGRVATIPQMGVCVGAGYSRLFLQGKRLLARHELSYSCLFVVLKFVSARFAGVWTFLCAAGMKCEVEITGCEEQVATSESEADI